MDGSRRNADQPPDKRQLHIAQLGVCSVCQAVKDRLGWAEGDVNQEDQEGDQEGDREGENRRHRYNSWSILDGDAMESWRH